MRKLTFILIVLNCTLGKAQVSSFSSSFENGSTVPDVGTEHIQTSRGGTIYVVNNPEKDAINESNKVIKISIPPGTSVRAEYQNSGRFPTEGKTHFYKWKVYYPQEFLEGVHRRWLVLAQWKTWPCEEYGTGDMDYSDNICWGGGIFNDISLSNGEELDFRFRAEPDCGHLCHKYEKESWVEYVLEIFWTNSSNGYYKLFANHQSVGDVSNVKTLFDNFPSSGKCNIYFALGLYSNWLSSGADSLFYYLDDINVYDKDNGVSLKDVCPECVNKKKERSGIKTGSAYLPDQGLLNIRTTGTNNISYSFSHENIESIPKITLINSNNYMLAIADEECAIGSDTISTSDIVKIFPNPAANYVIIETGGQAKNISITDISGKLKYSKKITHLNELIDLDVSSGCYIVKVLENNNKIITMKLIVK